MSWNVENENKVKIRVGADIYEIERKPEKVKEIARKHNIAVFDLYDSEGNLIEPEDFEDVPAGTTLELRTYNAPKGRGY